MTGELPRVGLFGFLGSGNIGNDASMESVLSYLRTEYPDAFVDAMCMGPERLRSAYAIDAIPLSWARTYEQRVPRSLLAVLKVLGKLADAIRIARWVSRHDVVIVPGMGVLETTLPLHALGAPYAFFLLSASGRVFGTKVALVSVGANVIRQPLTRWLYSSAARLACYVSYRDAVSHDAMPVPNGSKDSGSIYPDLAFGLPVLTDDPGDPQTVGVGVMDFQGSNDDRDRADQIRASYLEQMKAFVLALVDSGKTVRLFIGDTAGDDNAVVDEIIAHLATERPELPAGQVVSEAITTFTDLMRSMAPAGAVAAIRYHNIICALLLDKPTIAIGYAAKHRALMAEMGLEEFYQPADGLDSVELIDQLAELGRRSTEVRAKIAEHNAERIDLLARQFTALSEVLFPGVARTGGSEARTRANPRQQDRAEATR
jgi:polysaccharide pyruvyl transferase WcaK-like protein